MPFCAHFIVLEIDHEAEQNIDNAGGTSAANSDSTTTPSN